MAWEVACIISGYWPAFPPPHPSARVDKARSGRSSGSLRLRAGNNGVSPARALRPTPKSFEPPGERRRRCACGPSGHQGAPNRLRAGAGTGAGAGAGAGGGVGARATGLGQEREIAVQNVYPVGWFKMNKIRMSFGTISSDAIRLEYEVRYLGSEEFQLSSIGRSWGPKPSCARLVGDSLPM